MYSSPTRAATAKTADFLTISPIRKLEESHIYDTARKKEKGLLLPVGPSQRSMTFLEELVVKKKKMMKKLDSRKSPKKESSTSHGDISANVSLCSSTAGTVDSQQMSIAQSIAASVSSNAESTFGVNRPIPIINTSKMRQHAVPVHFPEYLYDPNIKSRYHRDKLIAQKKADAIIVDNLQYSESAKAINRMIASRGSLESSSYDRLNISASERLENRRKVRQDQYLKDHPLQTQQSEKNMLKSLPASPPAEMVDSDGDTGDGPPKPNRYYDCMPSPDMNHHSLYLPPTRTRPLGDVVEMDTDGNDEIAEKVELPKPQKGNSSATSYFDLVNGSAIRSKKSSKVKQKYTRPWVPPAVLPQPHEYSESDRAVEEKYLSTAKPGSAMSMTGGASRVFSPAGAARGFDNSMSLNSLVDHQVSTEVDDTLTPNSSSVAALPLLSPDRYGEIQHAIMLSRRHSAINARREKGK